MKREPYWAVRLHDDDINSLSGAVYVLNRTLGLPPGGALEAARDVRREGLVELARYSHRKEAEAMVRVLQLYGLHSSARESR